MYVRKLHSHYVHTSLQQYRNAGNPLAHYDGTGNEIIAQTGGIVQLCVCVCVCVHVRVRACVCVCTSDVRYRRYEYIS